MQGRPPKTLYILAVGPIGFDLGSVVILCKSENYMTKSPLPSLFAAFEVDVKTCPGATSAPTDTDGPTSTLMSRDEALARLRAAVQYTPASAFAHLIDEDDLGRALHASLDTLDRCDPDTQALIERASGTFHGALVAQRIAPTPTVGRPKAVRAKRVPKHRSPLWKRPSLFDDTNN